MTDTTFDELGMPFPLFRAGVSEALVDEEGPCRSCLVNATIRFHGHCYSCFRQGVKGYSVDTDYGMVGADQVAEGLTHGTPVVPTDPQAGVEFVAQPSDPRFPDERWFRARLDPVDLQELWTTPRFSAWQDPVFLIHCGRPAVFLGRFDLQRWRENAERLVTGDPPHDFGPSKFGFRLERHVADVLGLDDLDDAEDRLFDIERGAVSTFVFECQVCARLVGYVDRD